MVGPSGTPPIAHYVDLIINDLTANNITANTINNVVADATISVTLTNNNTTPVLMTSFAANYGIYILLIRPTTAVTTRPSAVFVIGRINTVGDSGMVARLLSVPGTNNEKLDIQWGANAKPSLLYRPAPGVVGTSTYSVRIITV
jgi:hypothetical protein